MRARTQACVALMWPTFYVERTFTGRRGRGCRHRVEGLAGDDLHREIASVGLGLAGFDWVGVGFV